MRKKIVGEKTLVKIEQALDWPAGRTYEILDGDRVSVRASGELLLNEPYAFTVSRESGEVLGVAGDGPIPLDERDWSRWSDTALAELIAQAAEELRERSLGRFVRVLNSTHDIAAYRPERESAYEQETSEQDVAAEGPDTPGPEDGA